MKFSKPLIIIIFFMISPFTFSDEFNNPHYEKPLDIEVSFENVDVKVYLKTIFETLDLPIVIDNNAVFPVTVYARSGLTAHEIVKLTYSILESNGYTLNYNGDIYSLVPLSQSTKKATDFEGSNTAFEVIKIDFINLDSAISMITPFMSQVGITYKLDKKSSIFVYDQKEKLKNIKEIIKEIDTVNQSNIKIYDMKLDANKAKNMISSIIDSDNFYKELKVISDEDNQRIILNGSDSQIARMEEIINKLNNFEIEVIEEEVEIEVEKNFYLYKANFINLEDYASEFGSLVENLEIVILPKNQAIIYAEYTQYKNFLDLMNELDSIDKQILIQSIIVESSGTDADALGLNVLFNNNKISANSNLNIAQNLSEISTLVTSGAGASLAFADFSAIVQAIEQSSSTELVSTPSVLTTDGKKATASFGQNVAFQTGISEGLQSITRADVSTKLDVTPQLMGNDNIYLEIKQTIAELLTDDSLTASTSNREITSNIIAQSGEVIVLGGIIKERKNEVINRFPILGYLPIIKPLFTSKSTKTEKVNLIIFIKATVIDKQNNYDNYNKSIKNSLNHLPMDIKNINNNMSDNVGK